MRGAHPFRTVAFAAIVAAVLAGCGASKRRAQCEKLEDRLVEISITMAQELQKLGPPEKRLDRATMEGMMRQKLDRGTFMQECMKLDPEDVECVSNAETAEEWQECGLGGVALP